MMMPTMNPSKGINVRVAIKYCILPTLGISVSISLKAQIPLWLILDMYNVAIMGVETQAERPSHVVAN